MIKIVYMQELLFRLEKLYLLREDIEKNNYNEDYLNKVIALISYCENSIKEACVGKSCVS